MSSVILYKDIMMVTCLSVLLSHPLTPSLHPILSSIYLPPLSLCFSFPLMYVAPSFQLSLPPSLPSDHPPSFIYVLLSGSVHQWVSTHIPFGQNPLRTKYFQFNINTDKPPSRHQYC